MEEEETLEIIRKEVSDDAEKIELQKNAPIAILRGRNTLSAKALLDQDLTIRCFPFHIGRGGRGNTRANTFRNEPDLSLEDHPPYRLSGLHLILERRGKEIFLVDPSSRNGSIVNNEPLGERIGGPKELPLSSKEYEIRLGGATSPFVYSIAVKTEKEVYAVQEQIRYGDRTLPVSLLYGRLYQQTQQILAHFFKDGPASLAMARAMVQTILANPDIIDPLYFFSATPETGDDVIATHSLNVAVYAIRLARLVPITGNDLLTFALAAFFHDIGLYDLPLQIINKKELVTAEEYELIKTHSLSGKTKLEAVNGMNALIPTVALEHHERVDGYGYPKGSKILSQQAEMIAMVDFFEALTHYRPQRGPVTPHEGMRILIEQQKGIFNPSMVKLFIRAFSLFPVYSIVRLNTGETGQVVDTNPDRPLRPTVRIFFDRHGNRLDEERRIDLSHNDFLYISKDITDRVFMDHCLRL